MRPAERVHTSYSTQLWLGVSGFVLFVAFVVIFLLARFSQDVIRNESIDTMMQTLENTALDIDNTLREMEMSARLEHQPLLIDEARIRRVLDRKASETEFRQLLPHVELAVVRHQSNLAGSMLSGGRPDGQAGEYRQLVNDGQKSYIFIQPIGRRPYSLTATFPAEDIYAKYERMQWVLLSWGIAAILTLLGLLYWAIVRHLKPLDRLADSAQAIAEGRLDTPIADTRRQDETGRLQNSLATMQQSLAGYISELRQKQDTLNQQHAALQAAYAETSAYEEKKSRFLHDMTERMAAPVARICRDTDTICRDFDRLSDDDMATLQTGVTRSSEDIITLLDQLIKDPAGT